MPETSDMENEKTESTLRPSFSRRADSWPDGSANPFVSARQGDDAAVARALANGMPVDVRNDDGQTCLMLAAAAGHEGVVALLLDAGADIHAADSHQRTASSLAASHGHRAVLQMLIDRGVSVDSPDAHERTLVMLAAANAHAGCVALLVDCGASLMLVDAEGLGALAHAMLAGDDESVRIIEAAGRVTASWATVSNFDYLRDAPSETGVGERISSSPSNSPGTVEQTAEPQMHTPLPRPEARINEPGELLSQLVQEFINIGTVLRVATRLMQQGPQVWTIEAAAEQIALRTKSIRELLASYEAGIATVRTPAVSYRSPDSASLDDVVVALDGLAEQVNWAVMILDSYGDDEGADMLRDARRELAHGAQNLRKTHR